MTDRHVARETPALQRRVRLARAALRSNGNITDASRALLREARERLDRSRVRLSRPLGASDRLRPTGGA